MKRTCVWMCLLLAGLGWYAWGQWNQLWSRRHEIIAAQMRARFAQAAPDWTLEFASVELLDDARVRVKELRIGHRKRREPLVFVPDVMVHLDRDLLAESLQVLATRIELYQPVVRLSRDAAGVWNWEDWPLLSGAGAPTPEIHCQDGTVQVRIAAGEAVPETHFDLSQINVVGLCRAFHQYDVQGESLVDTAGALTFTGQLDLDTWDWSLAGRCAELSSPDNLLQLAAGLSPDARNRLDALAAQCPAARPDDPAVIRPVANSAREPAAPRCTLPALGVSARMELAFRLECATETQPLQYQFGVRLQDGVIRNAALPLPLHDLSGELFLDNSQVVLKSLRASNGASRLFIDGHIRRDAAVPARKFVIQAQNLEFGREIESHLWGCLKTLYDTLRPAGRFNIDVAAETDPAGQWQVQLNQFEAFDCSVVPAVFPYPAHGVSGRIWQEQDRFLVDFSGFAGQQTVTARGDVRNIGPLAETNIAIQVRGVPIDDMLRGAFTTPKLEFAHRALEQLRLTGVADVDARVIKRGVPHEPVQVAIDARLRDGTMLCQHFPYQLTDVSGRILHDPLSPDPGLQHVWQLSELRARHGAAEISGTGGFAAREPAALLDLHFDAFRVPIDRELELACLAASPPLRELFDSVGRAGTVDLRNARLLWSPASRPVIALPDIAVHDAMVRFKFWPYPWERVQGQMAWEHPRLTISRLTGQYGGETLLEVDNGGEPTAAVLDVLPQGELAWQLHLEDVRIRRLIPDAVLRRSLIPSGVDAIVEKLDPRGPLDLDLGLDVKGYRQPANLVTAAWHLDARLQNNTVVPGVELSNVSGLVKIVRGSWDGARSFVDGYFELDSATALGVPFTAISGPFLVDGDDAYVGTPTWPEARTVPPYDPAINKYARRGDDVGDVQADVYGGKVGINVQSRLSPRDPEQSTYRAAVTVRDARLEAWAGENGNADRLRGPINGQMDFVGQGTSDRALRGRGWVQISPAQLYELPVLNRVLASFDLRQPDRTAFTYAYGEFQIHDGVFDFSLIDLVGESLRLVGRGTVAYAAGLDGRLAIDFFRSKFRNQIPVFGQIFSAVTTNSIGVRVGGTVDNPIVNVQPKLGIVDDTLRKLLDAFNAGQMPAAPRGGPVMGPPPLRNPSPR